MNWIDYANEINLFDEFDKDIKPMSKYEKYKTVRMLINYFLKNNKSYIDNVPNTYEERKQLLYKILNTYNDFEVEENILKIIDRFLISENNENNIVNINELEEIDNEIYIYKGSITKIKSDAIVSVSNCRYINDEIYSKAGLRLKMDYNKLKYKNNYCEYPGSSKITRGYCIPAKYIIHTVAPIITNNITKEKEKQLYSCYISCLDTIRDIDRINSIVFNCISTGTLGFPKYKAIEIAIKSVNKWKKDNNKQIKIIFNVSNDTEEEIYKSIFYRCSNINYNTI